MIVDVYDEVQAMLYAFNDKSKQNNGTQQWWKLLSNLNNIVIQNIISIDDIDGLLLPITQDEQINNRHVHAYIEPEL